MATVLRYPVGARLSPDSLRAEVAAALSCDSLATASFLAQQLVSLASATPADHYLLALCESRRGEHTSAFRILSESGLLAPPQSPHGWDAFLRARLLAAQSCIAVGDDALALETVGDTYESAIEGSAHGGFPTQRIQPRAQLLSAGAATAVVHGPAAGGVGRGTASPFAPAPTPATSSSSSSSATVASAAALGTDAVSPHDPFSPLRSLRFLPSLPRQLLQSQLSLLRARALLSSSRRADAAAWLSQALRYDAKCAAAWDLLAAGELLPPQGLAALLKGIALAPEDEWLRMVYAAQAGGAAVLAMNDEAESVSGGSAAATASNAATAAATATNRGGAAGSSLSSKGGVGADESVSTLSPLAASLAASSSASAALGGQNRASASSHKPHEIVGAAAGVPVPLSTARGASRRSLLLLLARLDAFPGARGLGTSPSALAALARHAYSSAAFGDCLAAHTRLRSLHGAAAPAAAERLCALTVLGRTGELAAAARALGQEAPDTPLAWFAKGCYAYALGEHAHAGPLWRRALASSRGSAAWLHLALGHAASASAAGADALLHYERAAAEAPAAGAPLTYLGAELVRQGRWAGGLAALRRGAAAAAGDAVGWHELACALLQVGDVRGAAAAAERAAAIVDDIAAADAEAPAGGARAGAGAGARGGAGASTGAAAVAVALEPFWEPVYTTLGHARRKLRDFPGAQRAYRQALLRCRSAAAEARVRAGVAVTLLLSGASPTAVATAAQAVLALDGGSEVGREVLERALAAVNVAEVLVEEIPPLGE